MGSKKSDTATKTSKTKAPKTAPRQEVAKPQTPRKPMEVVEVNLAENFVVIEVDMKALPTLGRALTEYKHSNGDPNPMLFSVGRFCQSACAIMSGDSLENHPRLAALDAENGCIVYVDDPDPVAGKVEDTLAKDAQ